MKFNQERVNAKIVHSLRNRPAHTLLFGVCLLLASLAAEAQLVATDTQRVYLFAIAGGLIVLALFFGALILRTPLDLNVEGSSILDLSNSNVGEAGLDTVVSSVLDYTRKAVTCTNVVFQEELSHAFVAFRDVARDYSRGHLSAGHDRYIHVLLRLYELAQVSVFSTTILEYLGTWESPLGARLLRAHQVSRAAATRVFVFNNRKEISGEAIEIMKRQRAADVRVLVYFDEEDPAFSFPADISRDFTVIDEGNAIGITVSYGGENLRALWHFEDAEKKPRFASIRKALEDGSVKLDDVLEWWKQRDPQL